MTRKRTGRPNGRPRTRDTAEARQRRCHTVMIYWMLIHEGQSPSDAKVRLSMSGGKDMAEFKNDDEVRLIRERKMTRAQYRAHVRPFMARVETAERASARAFTLALKAYRPMARRRPSVLAGARNPALLGTDN